MPSSQVFGVPGPQTARAQEYRCVRESDVGVQYLPQGVVINGSLSRDPLNTGYLHTLRPGLVMGKITASNKWAPSIIGLTTVDYTSGGTSLTVSAATAVEIVRRVGTSGNLALTSSVDATTAVVTASDQRTLAFSAVNTTTGVLTITSPGVNVVAGSFLGATDGSSAPLGLIDDGDGVRVTDVDGNNLDVSYPHILIGGQVRTDKIINYPVAANTALIAWLKGKLNNATYGYGFQFVDSY